MLSHQSTLASSFDLNNNVICYNNIIVTNNVIFGDSIMALVSFENVAAAAEALKSAGQSPSVRAVIAKLGGGSPNSVLQHLNDWKTGRPVVRAADTVLDSRITSAIAEQMQRVASEAAAAAEERAASIADDLQTISEAQQTAEQQIETLTAALATAQATSTQLTQSLIDSRADAERLKQAAEQQAITLRDNISQERARHEHANAALARAEVRLEAIQGLQEEITHLRVSLERERQAKQQAEQAAAVANARLLDAENRADAALIREKTSLEHVEKTVCHLREMLEKAEKATEKARESARILGEQAAELRGRLSIAAEKPQKHKATQKTDVKEQQIDVLDLLTSSMP
jgi:chromosome segregation ATPase